MKLSEHLTEYLLELEQNSDWKWRNNEEYVDNTILDLKDLIAEVQETEREDTQREQQENKDA